jgi:hypothetical protein
MIPVASIGDGLHEHRREKMRMWIRIKVALVVAGVFLSGCAADKSGLNVSPHPIAALASPPADPAQKTGDAAPEQIDWNKDVAAVIGKPGVLNAKDQVYTVAIPRTDIDLKIDGMSVPTAAGIASTFHFYLCSCGKTSVLGEFIVIDHEANDVIDALRAGALIRITGIGPIAIGDRPHLLSVRFHGEGDAQALSKLNRSAMQWTGEDRMKPNR